MDIEKLDREEKKKLIQFLVKDLEKDDNELPISIFDNDKLSALETISKFLKENKGMNFVKIAKILGRDQRTIWVTYNKAIKKMHHSLIVCEGDVFIPVEIFKDRKFSVLENLIGYLKDNYNLSYNGISLLLRRKYQTIVGTYKKYEKKR